MVLLYLRMSYHETNTKGIAMAINWAQIYRLNKGQWVALKDDEKTVIVSAHTAKEALINARKKGFAHPILAQMPKDLTAYVG